jgi:hypothetical protein
MAFKMHLEYDTILRRKSTVKEIRRMTEYPEKTINAIVYTK